MFHKTWRYLILLQSVLALLLTGAFAQAARADGGVVRRSLSEGDFLIVVFAEPTPLMVGPADVSVLVRELSTRRARPDLPVTLTAWPEAAPEALRTLRASPEAATNKLLSAAKFELPSAGRWRFCVTVATPSGPVEVEFDETVAMSSGVMLTYGLWLTWPLVVIALYLIHQRLATRDRSAFL